MEPVSVANPPVSCEPGLFVGPLAHTFYNECPTHHYVGYVANGGVT